MTSYWQGAVGSMAVIAHRGMGENPSKRRVKYPENTLLSFGVAIKLLGAAIKDLQRRIIEFDVWMTADGVPVVIHDDTFERTTTGTGLVKDASYKYIRKLVAGQGQRVPTLEQVLDLVRKRVVCNIELKGSKVAVPVAEIVKRYVSKGWGYENFVVSSFNFEELMIFRKALPEVRVALLVNDEPDWLDICQKLGACAINPNWKNVDREFVDMAHANNIKVFVWTVDEARDIESTINLGVDGICTNHLERLLPLG